MIEAGRVGQELPHDLEDTPPGPALATMLASVDRRLLDDRDRVRLAQARNRMLTHLQAELYADIYAISWSEPPDDGLISNPDEPYPWTTTELSMALRWTKFAAGVRLEQARRMIEDLPAVRDSLHDGLIEVPKALVILDGLAPLPPDSARPIADQVLKKAPELTTGQLRVWLKRLVLAADPATATQTAQQASRGRRVEAMLNDNHLADLAGVDLAPHRVAASWERLTAIAKAAKAAGDPRSVHELRADAMLDLLVGEGIAIGEPVTNGTFHPAPPPDQEQNPDTGSGSGSGSGSDAASGQADPAPNPATNTTSGEPGHATAASPRQQDSDTGRNDQRPARPRQTRNTDRAWADDLLPPRRRRWDHTLPPGEDHAGIAWPATPANPALLDPQADPPQPDPPPTPNSDPPTAGDPPTNSDPPPAPPDDTTPADHVRDADHEQLHPFWQAGFHQLPHTPPTSGTSRGGGVLPSPRRGVVELHMSVYTLMGYDHLPAELAGFGPILADLARQIIQQRPDLAHTYNIYDPDGLLLTRITTNQRPSNTPDPPTNGGRRTNRTPTTQTAAFVRARNRTCTRPGCRRHARTCQLDHTLAWSDGGETDPNNLGPQCTADHHFKHTPGSHLIQSTDGGRYGWITPKGMRYITLPDPPLYHDLDIIDPPTPQPRYCDTCQ